MEALPAKNTLSSTASQIRCALIASLEIFICASAFAPRSTQAQKCLQLFVRSR
jgi:hypothetical protein